MSSVKLLKSLSLAPGVTLEIKKDEAEPEDSIKAYSVQVIATGEDSAEAVYVPPHWHKNHTEYMTVIEGRMKITMNGKTTVLSAGDPPAIIPPRVVHSIQGFKGERLVVQEQADPAGDYKAMFFNDLLSQGGFGSIPHRLRAFYDGDTYLALPLYFRFIDEVFLTVFGGISSFFTAPKPTSL